MCEPFIFPLDNFLAEFPEFDNNKSFTNVQIARVGNQAQKYITEGRRGFPLICPDDRLYALFLMTAHILTLRKNAADELASGNVPAGGRVRKATVGAVTVETESPNQYTLDNLTYWLSQTAYGQELLSYLDMSAPAGLYLNTRRDSVRVL
jgi:hypothetical protein